MIHVHYNSGHIPVLIAAMSPFDFGGWEKNRRLIFFGWHCPSPDSHERTNAAICGATVTLTFLFALPLFRRTGLGPLQ